MTDRHDFADLPALEELGRRFNTATARSRRPAGRSRRTLALAAAGLALVATPAAAAITGIFDTPGPTVEEALPQVAEAIDSDDPAATGRDLRRLGFEVRWQLIIDNPQRGRSGASPTLGRDVPWPPAGTEILAVLNSDGSNKATEDTRRLLIEIAPAGSEILRSHEE